MNFIDLSAQYKTIKPKVDARIQGVLDHGQYIMGPEVAELEKNLESFVGVRRAITCANGTDALTIGLLALEIGHGDEIITTPFTFFATGETVALNGAKLVFVDIDPETYNIDANKIEEKITDKTKAIIAVSLYGQMPELTKITDIAKKHNLKVIEDAAQSFGATIGDKRSCSIADISTTSFFPAKPLGCYGDGGALFTNDDALCDAIKEIRNHGQSKRYTHTRLGLNSRLDTIQAAILLEKLAIFPEEVEKRQEVASRYDSMLDDRIKRTKILDGHKSVYAQYTIEVENREAVRAALSEMSIPTAVHYPVSIHKQPVFKSLGYGEEVYTHSEKASERVLSLPMHPYMEIGDQEKIISAVNKTISGQ